MQALKESLLRWVPAHEADQILFHVFRKTRRSLQRLGDLVLQNPLPGAFETTEALFIAEQRALGVPLQHLLGHQFFYSHEYEANASTLIPRPETEILVDLALRSIRETFKGDVLSFAELGLGSGVISCELLSALPLASGVASEVQPEALALARRNLQVNLGSNHEKRLKIIEAPSLESGFEVFQGYAPFDLVISNPPYLASDDEIAADVLAHEPKSALIPASGDPDYFYKSFLLHYRQLLRPGSLFFFEVPHERAQAIRDLFLTDGLSQVDLLPDLTGRPRILSGKASEGLWKN